MTAGWHVGPLRQPPAQPVRWVLKFGGSLLTRPRWPEELRELVNLLPGSTTIVAGGGPIVDGLRAVDAACPRPADVMHALAIEAMGITARLVAEASGLPIADGPQRRAGAAVLDAASWLATARSDQNLPDGWHVTSDSIAASVAHDAAATLVLAKRVRPSTTDLAALAAAGWVDAHMPVAAEGLTGILWAVPGDGPV
jgi:aspartokinase-like uncharacterized kinase